MSLRQELRAARKRYELALTDMLHVLERVDHLLSVAEGDDQVDQAADLPAKVVQPAKPDLTSIAIKLLEEWPIVSGVSSTWLDAADDASGETAKQPMYPWAPHNHAKIGLQVAGIALPFKVNEGDGADLRIPGRPWWYLPAIEGGPHHVDDDYLPNGRAARAQGEAGNKAIVDVTPAAQALLDGGTAEADYLHAPLRPVEIRWHPSGGKVAYRLNTDPDQRANELLARAHSLIDTPITYELGKQPPGPASDCSGFVDWCASIDRAKTGLNTDAIAADATGERPRFYTHITGPAQPGDVYVYPSPGAGHYGHTGVISAVDASGAPTRVIHCSSGNAAGRAVQETDPAVFTQHGAIIVRAVALPT